MQNDFRVRKLNIGVQSMTMENGSEERSIIVAVKRDNKISWFRSERDFWVMDYEKWKLDFENAGYEVPDSPEEVRFGIPVVDESSADKFLKNMEKYKVHKDELSFELATRYQTAHSYWDIADLFPSIFVDFDRKNVDSCGGGGVDIDNYVPKHWNGEYCSFYYKYSNEIFPVSEKYWIKGESDLFKLITERS